MPVLFAAGLLYWCSMASLLPTLPLYLDSVGATKQQIGLVVGSYAIGLLLFRPLLAKLAEGRGRKIVLLIGMIVATIAPLGYLFIKSVPVLFFLRAFHGISIAAFSTGFTTLVAELAPQEKRSEIISQMTLVNPLGMAIGPILGGYLLAGSNYKILFLVVAELAIVAMLGILQVVNPPIQPQQTNSAKEEPSLRILSSARVRVPALVLLLVGLAFGTLSSFVPLFIKSINVSLNAGLFYTVGAISSFTIRMFATRASERLGRGLFITLSLVCYTLALVLLYLANNSVSLLLAALLEGAGGGTLMAMIATTMAERSRPKERGRIFGLCIGGFDLGIALSCPLSGFLAQQLGYRNMFGCAAVLTLLALLSFLTLSSKSLFSSLRFALGLGQDAYALKQVKS
jgi:MFS family permease